MAKLNVTIPATNVMVDGVEYRKVDRKAQAGDIVKALIGSADIRVGDFFAVYTEGDGDLTFNDRAGDARPLQLRNYPSSYEVYENVSAKYREGKRHAKKGERIKIVDARCAIDYGNGEIYTVIDTIGNVGNVRFVDREGSRNTAWASEYVVLEEITEKATKPKYSVDDYVKVTKNSVSHNYEIGSVVQITYVADNAFYGGQELCAKRADGSTGNHLVTNDVEPASAPVKKRLTVGDYAKVLGPNDNDNNYEIGSIVKLIRGPELHVVSGKTIYKGKHADGTIGNYLRDYQLEPATEAEFLAQNRLKVGEFAKVIVFPTGYNTAIPDGSIVEITEDDGRTAPYLMKTLDGKSERWAKVDHVIRATEAEVAEAKAEIQRASKYGDFADGDYAEIVNATRDNSTTWIQKGAGKYVKVTLEPASGYRGLKLTDERGIFIGFANADALRMVTKEEYDAALDPRNKFAKGEKVRLISGGDDHPLCGLRNGDICEVLNPKYSGHSNKRVAIKAQGSGAGFALPEQLEKVSAEEVAAIEKEAQELEEKRREEQKWSAIGRKVNEYKAGDFVEITENRHAAGVVIGEICEVKGTEFGIINEGVRLTKLNPSGVNAWVSSGAIKLIVPVEQRFDKAEAA